ncbi:transposable element Tcb1 transposase [Trichonephila clavipes]|nr:transposable element Tcb1 transposase [Trichonephila clavipes]
MSRRKQRSAFDQVSEFDRGRIVDYRQWRNGEQLGPSCKEGTTDRLGRSHPPQCTTSREDRKIVRMVVTDRSVTSRTVAQHVESVTH